MNQKYIFEKAIYQGNIIKIKRLIYKFQKSGMQRISPLILAIQYRNYEVIDYFLHEQPKLLQIKTNIPPLVVAIRTRDFAIIELLLKNGCLVNQKHIEYAQKKKCNDKILNLLKNHLNLD